MTRRLHNWNYDNVIEFLKQHGFVFYRETSGSHEAWIKEGVEGEQPRVVGLHFSKKSYRVKAMKRIIRASGIPEETWIKWAGS